MENKPSISWGRFQPVILKNGRELCGSCRVNLIRSSKGWLALYYDDPDSRGEIIRVFNPKNISEYKAMMKTVAMYNYNTERLCPIVKAQMDGTVFNFD
jgi:hypothetical protein